MLPLGSFSKFNFKSVTANGITVNLTGDWSRVYEIINHINFLLGLEAKELVRKQSERVKQAIEEEVSSMTGKPYDPRRPVNTGLWWKETGELISNLAIKEIAQGSMAFFIGFSDGYHTGKSPITFQEIAEKNEINHPMLQKVWAKLEPEFKKEWDALLLKALRGGGMFG